MARIVKASRTGAGTVALTLRVRTLLRAVAGDQISTSMRIEGKDFSAGRPPRQTDAAQGQAPTSAR